ncbi:MAG: PEGA domain-containing protein [Myxococcota bacterium]
MLLGGSAGAAAPPPPKAPAKVLGLHVEGAKLSAKDRTDLFSVLQAKLKQYPDVDLQNPPERELTDEMIDLECVDLDGACLQRLGKKYQVDRVVYVEADPASLHVKVVEVSSGKMLRDKEQKVAGAAALAPAMEAEVEAVWGKPPAAPEPKPAIITIEADQPQALIYLGAEIVGTGRVVLEKPPGSYTFRIVAEGYEEQIVKVEATEGEAVLKPIALAKLEPIKVPPKEKKDKGGSGWVLWAVIGAVVVGGAVTAIALASGGGDDTVRGPAVLSIDSANAWRDGATLGGRP